LQGNHVDMRSHKISCVLFCFQLISLIGCGLSVPDIKEPGQGPDGTRLMEFLIKRRVYCDLKQAVHTVDTEMTYTKDGVTKPLLPDNWGAQISLLLQVDESTSFNPGVAFTFPFASEVTQFQHGTVTTPRSFSFGFGGTLSSVGTRIDKFDPFWTIGWLRQPRTSESICFEENLLKLPFDWSQYGMRSGSFILQSELGIDKWLKDALFTNVLLNSTDPATSPNKDAPDTVSIDIKFVVVSNANINPVWKLLPVTFNNGTLNLLSTGRTRTHDLLITLGPPNDTKTQNSHLASQFGQAVSTAIISTPPAPIVP
jgi:hypothetical protein